MSQSMKERLRKEHKDLWLVIDYLAMSQRVQQIYLVRAANEREARDQGKYGCLVVNLDNIPESRLPFLIFRQ